MTCWHQVLSGVVGPLVGTLAGFGFALLLFNITEKRRSRFAREERERERSASRQRLLEYLKREFEYNLSLLAGWVEEIRWMIFDVQHDNHEDQREFQYSQFQRLFFDKCLDEGVLYGCFERDEISNLLSILSWFDARSEANTTLAVQRWQRGRFPKADAMALFETQEKHMNQAQKWLSGLVTKLE